MPGNVLLVCLPLIFCSGTAIPLSSTLPPSDLPGSAAIGPVGQATQAPREETIPYPIAMVEALSDSTAYFLLVAGLQRRAYDPAGTGETLVHPPYTLLEGEMDPTLIHALLLGRRERTGAIMDAR